MKTSNAQRHEKIQVGYVKRAMDIAADVITCPGGLGDSEYPALEIQLKEFKSPYVLRLTLPAVVYKALSEQMDPLLLYDAIASAVNNACAAVGADDNASFEENSSRATLCEVLRAGIPIPKSRLA